MEALALMHQLAEADASGGWDLAAQRCSSEDFQIDDVDSWREWRNSLPAARASGLNL